MDLFDYEEEYLENAASHETVRIVTVYEEVLRKYIFDMREIADELGEKLVNCQKLTAKEHSEVCKSFVHQIYKVDLAISVDKLEILAKQFVVKFKGLIEKDEQDNVRGEGCDKLIYSLETKLDYLRRKDPLPFQSANYRQLPKTQSSLDKVYEDIKSTYDSFMHGFVAETTRKEVVLEMLKSTIKYQRADIQSRMRKDPYNAIDGVISRWPFLMVSFFKVLAFIIEN